MKLTKNSKAQAPAWHPDFRNQETLPDIKAVRTGFLINFFAVAVALVLLTFAVYQEISIYYTKVEAQNAQQEVKNREKENANYLKQSKEFIALQPTLEQVVNFTSKGTDPTVLISTLGRDLPADFIFNSIEVVERSEKRLIEPEKPGKKKKKKPQYEIIAHTEVNLNGTVRADYQKTLTLINEFIDSLSERPEVAPYLPENVDDAVEITINRNRTLTAEEFDFKINIRLNHQPTP